MTTAWQGAVTNRASEYVSQETWLRMADRRRRKKCVLLADMASAIFQGKDAINGFVGTFVGEVVYLFGAGREVKVFAQELHANTPFPASFELTAVARGLQVTGVLLCSINGDDLTRCQCFVDLALVETKEKTKNILVDAMGDWVNLGSRA